MTLGVNEFINKMSVKTAFIFPGQGSQSVGMLKEFSRQYKKIHETFDEASSILSRDLYTLISKGSPKELNKTINTQPIMLTASIAIWRIWTESTDHVPAVMAGHSLGEYTALVCAGALPFKGALHLVSKRAELMEHAMPNGKGAMAAIIGLDKNTVIKLCKKTSNKGNVVESVNFNAPMQTVIAGVKTQVENVMNEAKKQGAYKCVMLAVNVPSHSSLMKEAATEFAKEIENIKINPPKIKVLHNFNAQSCDHPKSIMNALIKQFYMPVKWVDVIHNITVDGIEHFVEIGPGNVLSSLVKRIDKSLTTFSINNPHNLNHALEELMT